MWIPATMSRVCTMYIFEFGCDMNFWFISVDSGATATVKCVSHYGNPPAVLKWYLGDQEIAPLHPQANSTEPDNPRTWSAASVVQVPATKERHGMPLKCLAFHEYYSARTVGVEARMDVRCKFSSNCYSFVPLVLIYLVLSVFSSALHFFVSISLFLIIVSRAVTTRSRASSIITKWKNLDIDTPVSLILEINSWTCRSKFSILTFPLFHPLMTVTIVWTQILCYVTNEV